jgi:tRNA threonylcarbamoyladenosine biosynthesis protein TsaB
VKIIAFDTTMDACSVAVCTDDHVIARRHEYFSNGHAEQLMPTIQSVLAEADTGYGEIDLIAVTVGPGKFTGIRVGLSAARGIALTTGVSVVGVSTLDVIAEGARARSSFDRESTIMVIHNAFRDELFCQMVPFGAAVSSTPPFVVALADAVSLLPLGPVTVVGSGVSILKDQIISVRSDVTISDAPNFPDAADLARIGDRIARHGQIEKWPPEPIYIRAPDARVPAGQ